MLINFFVCGLLYNTKIRVYEREYIVLSIRAFGVSWKNWFLHKRNCSLEFVYLLRACGVSVFIEYLVWFTSLLIKEPPFEIVVYDSVSIQYQKFSICECLWLFERVLSNWECL